MEEDWKNVQPRRRRLFGWWVYVFLGLVVVADFCYSAVYPRIFPIPKAVVTGAPNALELSHLDLLGRALKLHADEHDGKYPASIDDIHWRQAQPGMDWAGLPAAASRFHEVGTGKVLNWLYFNGHTESDPPDTILVASPVALGKDHDHRMVSRINGVTEVIDEGGYQRQVAPGT